MKYPEKVHESENIGSVNNLARRIDMNSLWN